MAPPRKPDTTIRRLHHHTSGLRDAFSAAPGLRRAEMAATGMEAIVKTLGARAGAHSRPAPDSIQGNGAV